MRDANGQLLSSADGIGNKTAFTYDHDGNLTSQTDPCGQLGATCATSSPPCPSGSTCASGTPACPAGATCPTPSHTVEMVYDHADRLTRQTSLRGLAADGTPTTLSVDDSYDALGRLEYESGPAAAGGGSYGATSNHYEYDGVGNLDAATDRNGHRSEWEYDAVNRLTSRTDPTQSTTRYSYLGNGREVKAEDATHVASYTIYDPTGRPLQQFDGAGNIWSVGYKPDGAPSYTQDPDGVRTNYVTDGNDRVTQVNGQGLTTSYGYDKDGVNNSVTHGSGTSSATSKGCDDYRGRLSMSFDALGYKTVYEYDSADRLIARYDPGRNGSAIQQAATACPADEANPDVPAGVNPRAFSYDANGRLTSAADELEYTNSYTYDVAGDLTKQVLPKGGADAYSYAYNRDGYQVSQTDPANHATHYTPDAVGQTLLTTTPDAAGQWKLVANTFDDNGQLTCRQAKQVAATEPPTDPATQFTACTSETPCSSARINNGYDDAGRLTKYFGRKQFDNRRYDLRL